jgi:alpha-L-rhamnosidase
MGDNGHAYGQSDSYVLKGGIKESYEPCFTWHGFRFVDVMGSEDLKTHLRVEARVVHSDVEEAGDFQCSNALFNRILHNYRWSQRNNMHCGVPSDCPHRERVGYTGDGQTSAEAAIFNFDMSRFYKKWINDISDAQNSTTGYVPHSAPFEGGGGGPAWGSAIVIMPWILYLYYGDRRVLEEHYTGMKRWVEYLKTRTGKDGIVIREEPGDWDLGEWATPARLEIPPALVNTCYYAYVAQLVEKSAAVLGETKDIAYFHSLADDAAAAVNRRFFDESRAQYWEGRQGANVFPLAFGLVPPEHKKAVFDRLVEVILNENHSHFDTGMFATRLVLNVLTEGGRGDLAYSMMNQQTEPSFGWQIAQGATTLWENWNGEGSHDHAMFGGVCAWFYRALAGINPDPVSPGFKHILIKPYLLGNLSHVEARYRSVHGEIRSSWVREKEEFNLSLTIPGNCAATVLLPNTGRSRIQESGQPLARAAGVRSLGLREGRAALRIESGSYNFSVV